MSRDHAVRSLRQPDEPGADAPPELLALRELLSRSLPAFLATLIDDDDERASFAISWGVSEHVVVDEIRRALTGQLRPARELVDAIHGMSPDELDELDGALYADTSRHARRLFGDYNVAGSMLVLRKAIAEQRGFYARFDHVTPDSAAAMLASADQLRRVVARSHASPARVVHHVEAILQRIRRS